MGTMSRMHATPSRDERRGRARSHRQPTATPMATTRRCIFCFAPISLGALVCSEACDEAAWKLCPTLDGELYEPS